MVIGIADTHAIIWYLADDRRLSARAVSFMDDAAQKKHQIGISAITFVEIVYIERKRIPAESLTRLVSALETPNNTFIEVPLDIHIARTLTQIEAAQIPEMPDRIIAATALHLNVPVISRDSKIQSSNIASIW